MRRLTCQRFSDPVARKPKPTKPGAQGQPPPAWPTGVSSDLGNAPVAAASPAADSSSHSRVRMTMYHDYDAEASS
jgi:hypothetical protein